MGSATQLIDTYVNDTIYSFLTEQLKSNDFNTLIGSLEKDIIESAVNIIKTKNKKMFKEYIELQAKRIELTIIFDYISSEHEKYRIRSENEKYRISDNPASLTKKLKDTDNYVAAKTKSKKMKKALENSLTNGAKAAFVAAIHSLKEGAKAPLGKDLASYLVTMAKQAPVNAKTAFYVALGPSSMGTRNSPLSNSSSTSNNSQTRNRSSRRNRPV